MQQRLSQVKEDVINKITVLSAVFFVIPYMLSLSRWFDMGWKNIYIFHTIVYIAVLGLAVYRKQFNYSQKTIAVTILYLLISFVGLYKFGLNGGHYLAIVAMAIISTLTKRSFAIYASLVILSVFSLIAIGYSTYSIDPAVDLNILVRSPFHWLLTIVTIFSVILIFIYGFGDFYKKLLATVVENEKVTNELLLQNELLEKSDKKYQMLFDNANDAIFILNGDCFIDCNEKASEYFKLSKEELVGKKVAFFSPTLQYDGQESVKRIEEIISNVLNNNPQRFEWLHKKFTGELFDSIVSLNKITIQGTDYIQGILLDITEDKRTEEILKKSENKYKSLFENSADGILVLNEKSEILELNNKICEILGYSHDELILLKGYEFIHSDDLAGKDHEGALAQLLNGDTLITQYRLQKKDGSYIPTELSTKMIAEGQFLNIVRDITERKLAERIIQDSETKYRSFFENSMDAILLTSLDGNIHSANPAACAMFGYSEEEIIKLGREGLTDFTDPRVAILMSERENHGKVKGEITLLRKGRIPFEAEISSAVFDNVSNNTDEVKFSNMIIRDITERKQAEKSIQKNEKILSFIFNNHSDMQILVSTDDEDEFRVIAINKPYLATTELLGIDLDVNDVIGKPVRVLNEAIGLSDEYYEATIAKYKEVVNTGKPINFLESLDISGQIFTLEITLSPVMNENGECQYLLYNSHNITEQTNANMALKESEEKFKKIFLTSPDFVTISNIEDKKYIDVNENFLEKSGYTREEIIGKTSMEINIWHNTEDRERMLSILDQNGYVENMEAKFNLKNGTVINGLLSAALFKIDNKAHILTITRDISELKQTERAFKETASNLRSIIDNREDLIWSIDCDFNYIIFNNAYKKIVNNEYNIVLKKGMSSTENLAEEEADYWIPLFESVFEGESVTFEHQYTFNNEVYHFQTSLHPIIEDNIVTGASGLSIDITQRKLLDEALQLSEEKFKKTFRLSPYMVSLSTMEGQIVEVNDRVFSTLGYTKKELITNPTVEFPIWVDGNEREKFTNFLKSDDSLREMEVQFRKKTGEICDYLLSACIIEINGRELFLSITQDITDRKKAEIALVNEKNILSAIIENIPVMLTRYDPGTNILYLNKEFEEKIGWKTEDLQTINLMEMVYPDSNYREEVLAYMQAYTADWKEFVVHSKTGALIDSEWCNLRLADGTQIGIGIDITEEKKNKAEIINLNLVLEDKVKQRTAQLETINKELETFSYSVSHDLKAPLRGIDGYSKLLFDFHKTDLAEEAQLFIEKIRSSTHQMNRIIDDLLDYSRLERSQLQIGKIKIKDFIESILSIYSEELKAGYFKLDTKIEDIKIIADTKGLSIAFRNLIENAIKFTKAKTNPTIKIEIEETDSSWIISVKDNGIGFDMQYHHKIFNIFQRLQRAEDFPGTGIGLALVSKAMQRMHGKTWAESIPNVGSTFYLEIPKT
ncbi:PAS domain-containing sensor histidine kinase [Flavobacterium gelidilacus]|uniref:PAS domain-containing sensor histidine kinase n=1 Tax=Flavobacterium gelidilacus TaxID=206041 RepID=UPI000685255F|nr:PAS domain-containing sensor histidine kinase [Flavobacterium gelidilacus]